MTILTPNRTNMTWPEHTTIKLHGQNDLWALVPFFTQSALFIVYFGSPMDKTGLNVEIWWHMQNFDLKF